MKRCAIIGGGISGLATAYFLQKQTKELIIDVYEAQNRLGGVIRTDQIDGVAVDAGPDSFLTQKKAALTLSAELGLQGSLVASSDEHRKTYLFHEGRLEPLPEGFTLMIPTKLMPLLTTKLLSWPGKLDAINDLFSLPQDQDCSVAEFIERRFGKEILQRIAEPLIAGIYGSNVERLSLRSALPQFWEMQKKGSMILSMLRMRRRAASTESLFTTFKGGMETLVVALQQQCSRVNWRTGITVREIQKSSSVWKVEEQTYDILVISSSQAPLPKTTACEQIENWRDAIRRNSAVVIVLSFDNVKRIGFGWLVPEPERRSVLGCTYLNNKFAARFASGPFFVRLFIGGEHARYWIDQSDASIYKEVFNELTRIANIVETPRSYRIYRWREAMPEYPVGHLDAVQQISMLMKMEGNLYMTGNIFAGIGIPDCIAHAEKTAKEIIFTHELR